MNDREFRVEIRVRGHLGETMQCAFPELDARTDGRDTLLTGPLSDQPALHGALAQIEALGLELLEVRRVADGGVEPGPDQKRKRQERFR